MSTSTAWGTGAFGTGTFGADPFYNVQDLISSVLTTTAHRNPLDETSKRASILDMLNAKYQAIIMGKHWTFMHDHSDFNLEAPYTTGTVSLTNGDETVTGTSTEWAATIQARDIFFLEGSSQVYRVASLTSTTALELETQFSEETTSGDSYTIARNAYKMPKECGEILNISLDGSSGVLRAVGLSDLRYIQAKDPTRTGQPQVYSLVSQSDEDDDRFNIEFWPCPDQTYNLHIDYKKKIFKLEDASDCFPVIPDHYRGVLYYGALSDFLTYIMRDPEQGLVANRTFEQFVVRMENDKQMTDQRPMIDASRNYRKRGRGKRGYSYSAEDFGKLP